MSSSLVPLKIFRIGEQCTVNLSRLKYPPIGVEAGEGVPAQGWRINGTPPIKTDYILMQYNKIQYEVLRTNASDWSQFSARFSQFEELPETLEFLMYPDETPFNKLNLS
ncbi:hypothetical protein TNCV_3473611 [Trichonephila clavipes]|nr:hypothetical protein TNCV_3473611 [Trichonephila clavipes]